MLFRLLQRNLLKVAKLLEKTGVTSEARRKVTSEDVAQVGSSA